MSNFDNFGQQMAQQASETFGWDTPITAEEEKQFVLLEPGEYAFKVVDVEKGRYEPSPTSKIPSCSKAVLTLEVEGGSRLKHTLLYYAKGKWKVDNAFIGTGVAKENEAYTPNPDLLLGRTGICFIEQQPGYNDPSKLFNSVAKIIRPEVPATNETTQGFGGF